MVASVLFTLSATILALALLPTVFSAESVVPRFSSGPIGVAVFMLCVAFLLTGEWFAMVLNFLMGLGWLYIFVHRAPKS